MGSFNFLKKFSALRNIFYILLADILSRSFEKYTKYHPCVIIIKYNSKKGLLTFQRINYE